MHKVDINRFFTSFRMTHQEKSYLCNMNTTLLIHSNKPMVFDDFLAYLEIPSLVLDFKSETPESIHWYFHREGTSTTLFAINYHLQGTYEVSVDNLASYDDLRFFPYLVDSLAKFLQGTHDFEHIYEVCSIRVVGLLS